MRPCWSTARASPAPRRSAATAWPVGGTLPGLLSLHPSRSLTGLLGEAIEETRRFEPHGAPADDTTVVHCAGFA
jgi:hypothetical protein